MSTIQLIYTTTAPSAYRDLLMNQGATFQQPLQFNNTDGSNTSFANTTISAQLKKSPYTANIAANLSIDMTNAATGLVVLNLDAANTANLQAGKYFYDLILNYGGTIQRLMQGIVKLDAGITNITPPQEGIPAL